MRKILRTSMLTALLCTALATIVKADELIIVKGDQKAAILVSSTASPVEQYAARELQRAIQLMSGVQLRIATTGDTILEISQIIIGIPATNNRIMNLVSELQLQGAGEEQIAVQRIGNTLYLTGNTPRAALYATYTFLTDVLGARWFWPGDSGEYFPQHETITIDQLRISEKPDLAIRSLAITGVPNGDPDTDTWMARNRLNLVSSRSAGDSTGKIIPVRREKGFMIRIAGHNVVLPEALLKAHPEYLAEIGGKRQFHPRNASHLCWSNPNVQNEVVNMIASWWQQSPYPDIVHFYPADQTLYCQCTACKAMGDISTRWQKFSHIIITKLNQLQPGKKYWTYAYLEYKKVPDTTPAPFELIPYALYDVSYRHLLSADNAFNKGSIAEIDGWMNKGVNAGIRGYEYIIFKEPMFVPMVSWVVDQMQWMHSKKLAGYMSELPAYGMPRNVPAENTYWTCNRMALYAATKAMWNTNITAEEIVEDWCTKIYGPAAGDMIAYYREMEQAWRSSSQKITIFINSAVSHVDEFLSQPSLQKQYDHFSKAFATIASITDKGQHKKIESQISLEKKMLDNWQKMYTLKHARASLYTMDTTKKGILLYDGGLDSSPLSVELQQRGWDVAIESSGERVLKPFLSTNAAALLIRYSRSGNDKNGLSDKFLSKDVKRYINKGGVVILAAEGEIPVEKWFREVPAVKWTGSERVSFRKASFIHPGNWQTYPNDMDQLLKKGLTPNKGYIPISAGWETMAAIPMANGEEAPFLLRKRIGKGWLVLTSAPMGFGGGFEMLSARNAVNVVKLIENLQVEKATTTSVK